MTRYRTRGTVATLIFALIGLMISLSSINQPLHFIFPVTNAFGQSDGESPSDGSLKLAYTKLGVLSGAYQKILYDSNTKSVGLTNISASLIAEKEPGREIISSSQGLSQSQSSSKTLSDTDQMNLIQNLNNGFFQANSIYPPDPSGAQDYTLNVLSATLDNRSHSVIWTDTSMNVPAVLNSIVNTIESAVAK